jgi:hypothetical protein
MSIHNFAMSNVAGASAQGGGFYPYLIDNSLRMSDADNTTLQWTAGTPSSSTTWTMSFWIKRWNQSTNQGVNEFFSAGTSGSAYSFFSFVNHYITHQTELPGGRNKNWTNQLWRDSSAWYHFVFRADLNEGTQANRLRMYVNGVEYTATSDGITQSTWSFINASGVSQNWGGKTGIANGNPGCDHYLADINFCDGQSYAPTEFAETKDGIWVPKDTSGLTFGNNGYRLEFEQIGTGQNASGIGADTSGNGNHFAVSGLAASDVVPDSPTNNFATWNSLRKGANFTTSEGNLKAVTNATAAQSIAGTFGMSSGKWYWEVRNEGGSLSYTGIVDDTHDMSTYIGSSSSGSGYAYNTSGQKVGPTSGTAVAYGATYTTGDIIGIALDMDAGTLVFYKNGVSQGTAFTGLTGTWFAATSGNGVAGKGGFANFGQDSTFAGATTAGGNTDANGIGDFKYAVPSGFLALCNSNLSESDIGPNSATQSDDYFNTVLYSATAGAAGSVTGYGFAPDWLWTKARNATQSHQLFDSVRGDNNILYSNLTNAESAQAAGYFTLEADGFNYGTSTFSSNTYVGWGWKAGGTAVSNTDGSITSQVSANTTAGFSIVTYTGTRTSDAGETGTPTTIGHGLGKKPAVVITKARDTTTNARWNVWHQGYQPDQTYLNYQLWLDQASAANNAGWQRTDTGFSTTTFCPARHSWDDVSGIDYVAYCFAEIEGFSKFGSYTGTGNADGPFIYTGFRPSWVLFKNSTATESWHIIDSERSAYNVANAVLYPNSNAAESNPLTAANTDFLSNGFKIRAASGNTNDSGQTYIYMAFAESPFKYSNAR